MIRKRYLTELRSGNLLASEVARLLGLTPQAVSEWARRRGIDARDARARYVARVAQELGAPTSEMPKMPRAHARKRKRWSAAKVGAITDGN